MRAWAVPLGNVVTRYQSTILPLLVLGAYVLAVPSPTVFGSETLELARDLLGIAVASLGLMLRARIALRARPEQGSVAVACGSNLLIALGILLVHGDPRILAGGILFCAFLLFCAFQAEEAPVVRSGRLTVLGRIAARVFPRDRSAGSLWITGAATAAVLGLTELYERLPQSEVQVVRLALLALIVLLLADAVLALRGGAAPVPAGRAEGDLLPGQTRGILVSGRSGSVDILENALSLGNRDAILEATLAAAELRPGARVLDVGCGTGRLAIRAAGLFPGCEPVEAFGVDATPEMVELARGRAAAEGSAARFETGIGEALPFGDRSLDAVTSSYFFHHLPPEAKREAFAEMLRVARPGGRIVITDYGRPKGIVGLLASFPMRFNFYEYTRAQLKGELEAIVRERGFEPEFVRRFLGYITVMRVRKPG